MRQASLKPALVVKNELMWNFLHEVHGFQMELQGLSVIASGLSKIFKPFRNKENTCQSQHVQFFPKQSHKFDRKTTFHHISFHGP